MFAIFNPLIDLAYHVVSALAAGLAVLPAGLAAAAAITVFTMAVRLAVLPLSYYAMRGQAAQTRVVPELRSYPPHLPQWPCNQQARQPRAQPPHCQADRCP